jgi:transposase
MGRRRKFTDEQEDEIRRLHRSDKWTAEKLSREVARRFKVRVSSATIKQLKNRMN